MLVRNCMSQRLVTVEPQQTLEAARSLLRRRRIHHLPVIRKHKLIAIVTDRDLRGAPAAATVVADVMTRKPVAVAPDTFVDDAARVMRANGIGALPVLDGKKLVGILTASDVLDAFVSMSGAAEPKYRLVLSGVNGAQAERQVRDAVQRGGELKWIQHDLVDRSRLHLRLKARSLGDVDEIVAALEAAGFEVVGLVAHSSRAA